MVAVIRVLMVLAACAFAANATAQGTGLRAKPPASKASETPKAPAGPAAQEDSPMAQAVGRIFKCVAEGLPENWRRAWIVVTELAAGEKDRKFEGAFFYSLDPDGTKPVPLAPCSAREVAQGVYALNDFLDYEKRSWKVATLTFTSDGNFEIKYDYVK